MNRKDKTQAVSAGPAWGKDASTHVVSIRKQAQKAWSTTIRERKPLSLKHLRGLGCSDY